jgi:hypothetical protein
MTLSFNLSGKLSLLNNFFADESPADLSKKTILQNARMDSSE